MNLELAPEHRERVEAFQRRRRTGLVTLVFTDLMDSVAARRQLAIKLARTCCKYVGNSAGKPSPASPTPRKSRRRAIPPVSRPLDAVKFAFWSRCCRRMGLLSVLFTAAVR
ncbi:MAG: hypothetical protein O2960_11165 [Verrucomicrobia bacterium]|nr:hypothetical protein [Verrucomicrobiota bacterium]